MKKKKQPQEQKSLHAQTISRTNLVLTVVCMAVVVILLVMMIYIAYGYHPP